ncbi:hypothetical protein LXL04_035549 [Taraxacum kok-saghyz]
MSSVSSDVGCAGRKSGPEQTQTELAEERTEDHGTTSSHTRRSDRGVTSHYFASVALSVRGCVGAWPGLVDGIGTRPGESGRAGLYDLGGLDSGCNRWSEDLRCDCDEPATFSISRTDENPGRSCRSCPNFQLYVELDQAKATKDMHMQMLKVLKLMLVMLVVMLGMLVVLLVVVKKD